MTTARICEIEPFRYQSVPQTTGDAGASSNQINEQGLEEYLSRMREALCDDIQELIDNPSTGVDTFLELLDTPDSYEDDAGKAVVVNAAETALEYFPTTFTGQGQKMVVVKSSEDGFELQTQPAIPDYFLTPRLSLAWAPTGTAGQFGHAMTAVVGAQVVIPSSPANALAASYRFSFTAAAALNSNALGRGTAFQCIRGAGAPRGGFKLRWRFGIDQYGAGARCFVGLYSSVAAQPFTVANPSALLNTIFLGFDAADSTWQIMHNDGAGACTKVNTTLAINATSLLELVITMQPSAADFDWELHDLEAGTSFSGNVNTNLPVDTQPLNLAMQIGSAASGVQNRINHVTMFLETGPTP